MEYYLAFAPLIAFNSYHFCCWALLLYFSPPVERFPLAPEDEELLRDDEAATPLKRDGIKRKERPSDQGVSWLVKTQYISPLSNDGTKQVIPCVLLTCCSSCKIAIY